jgi:UDP-N-acetylglucosamine transferase subunit ALG13
MSNPVANDKRINIALVCTAGGHFEQMTNLCDFYSNYKHFWITHRTKQTVNQPKEERIYYIELAHFTRPWSYLFQIGPVLRIFAREKPTHVLSTGSGVIAFMPLLLSWILRVKFIHIETFSRVRNYTILGKFLLKTGNKIYTQWKDSVNRNVMYIGPIFQEVANDNKPCDCGHILVTVGTRPQPFVRLLKGVEDLVKKGVIKEKVIVQAGHTKYSSDYMELFDFCTPQMIDEFIRNARYVITQESAGIGTQCLKSKTRFIVMPRDYQYGELPSRSDMKEDLQYKLDELGYTKVVRDAEELEKAIEKIESLKVGFNFDNSLAIQTLKDIIEK